MSPNLPTTTQNKALTLQPHYPLLPPKLQQSEQTFRGLLASHPADRPTHTSHPFLFLTDRGMLCPRWTNRNQWMSLHPTTSQHNSPFPRAGASPNCPVQWHQQHSSPSSWFFIFTLPLHFPIPAHTEHDELQQGRCL